jgi:hypothetical protein
VSAPTCTSTTIVPPLAAFEQQSIARRGPDCAAPRAQPGTGDYSSRLAVDHEAIALVLQTHQLTDGSRDQQSTGNEVCLNVGYNLVS